MPCIDQKLTSFLRVHLNKGTFYGCILYFPDIVYLDVTFSSRSENHLKTLTLLFYCISLPVLVVCGVLVV